jgi:formylglycine-generating enzyme required for sulfatase activity
MSSSQWFYLVNGKQFGPFSEAQLVELFHKPDGPGPEALVWNEAETGEWLKASKVEGLLPQGPTRPRLRLQDSPPPPPVTDPPRYSSGGFRFKRSSLWLWLGLGAAALLALAILIPMGIKLYQKLTNQEPVRQVLLPDNVRMELRMCPAGIFTMGSPDGETGREASEIRHQVTLSKPFWMGRGEVTQVQWEAVMGKNPATVKDGDLPVDQVSWSDAASFCQKLTELERQSGRLPDGYEYRLPTEAEWEYACRAKTSSAYHGGNDPDCLDGLGWYKQNSDGKMHPGGQKRPNAWGLCDMHGNVAEWCRDWKTDYSTAAVTDPAGPIGGKEHVIRGGGWSSRNDICRSAIRDSGDPNLAVPMLGFRVALAPLAGKNGQKKSMVTGAAREVALSDIMKIELVSCPAGSFTMGSPINEFGRQPDETEHQVTLTKPFWLGKTEVTQEQWAALGFLNGFSQPGNNLPAGFITWDKAMAYCGKLTELESQAGRIPQGYEYRLPTEAEWEYACRAGSTGSYAGAATDTVDTLAWHETNGLGKANPVAQKTPNAWGLYDMHGNVKEWCMDAYGDYPAASATDPVNLALTDKGYIFRGGGFFSPAAKCRSANRERMFPNASGLFVGFRIALAPIVARPIFKSPTNGLVAPPMDPSGPQGYPNPRPPAMSSGTGQTSENGEVRETKVIRFDNNLSMTLRPCPAGTFTMGSPFNEIGRTQEEVEHSVTISKQFWMAQTEITQAQWLLLMRNNPSTIKANAGPVQSVTWEEAVLFCQKLAAAAPMAIPDGYEVRLPTEAEWEYACRAGSITPFAGNLSYLCWNVDNSNRQPHYVKQKAPNAWGLYDMHGNVWEWCYDWYAPYPAAAVTDPHGPTQPTINRAIRGGSWLDAAISCRSANRGWASPTYRGNNVGFRVVIAPILK